MSSSYLWMFWLKFRNLVKLAQTMCSYIRQPPLDQPGCAKSCGSFLPAAKSTFDEPISRRQQKITSGWLVSERLSVCQLARWRLAPANRWWPAAGVGRPGTCLLNPPSCKPRAAVVKDRDEADTEGLEKFLEAEKPLVLRRGDRRQGRVRSNTADGNAPAVEVCACTRWSRPSGALQAADCIHRIWWENNHGDGGSS